MADVFISYAREDRAFAQALAHALEEKGWSVWWDHHIPIGRTFSRAIEHELERARSVIVLWSSSSVKSNWVLSEAAEAQQRNVLIPAVIEPGVRLPLEFRRIQAADLSEWRQTGTGLEKLVSAIATVIDPGRADETNRGTLPTEEGTSPRSTHASDARMPAVRIGPLAIIVMAIAITVGVIVLWPVSTETHRPELGVTSSSEKPGARANSRGAVVDNAGVLSGSEITTLENLIATVQSRDLVQIRIYIAPALPQGEKLEDLTLRIANLSYGRDAGRGAMLFVFIADRLIRIEVGSDLEQQITNEDAAAIIASHLAPALRRGAYAEGLQQAVVALGQQIE